MTSKARNLLGFFKNQKFKQNEFGTLKTLFHPLNESPIPSLRALGERISNKGKCPIEGVGPLKYYCPISGYPTHSSKEAYEKDSHHRNTYATRLREVNEDEHDLRSGREMKEFEMPGLQDIEQTVNLKSWEMLFYTRNFNSVDNLRSQRHLSRLLSYPMTIAGILHELGPYADRAGGRVTPHGERSLLALRYMLHKQPLPYSPPTPPIRIFIPGARAESQLPSSVWMQLAHLFPYARFQIYFVGPEVVADEVVSPYGVKGWQKVVDTQLTLNGIQANWEQIHDSFFPFDPFTDIFFNFHPGLGFPSMLPESIRPSEGLSDSRNELVNYRQYTPQVDAEWAKALDKMLETKCPIILTAFSPSDMKRDFDALLHSEAITQEWESVVEPGDNVFGSQRWEVAEFDTRVMIKSNWGLWGIRGRRFDLQNVSYDD